MPRSLAVRNHPIAPKKIPELHAAPPFSVSRRSTTALDALNVFVADMRDGVGPYLTLFLVGKAGWTPSRIGWALAAASTATLIGTTPAGWLLDSSRSKRAYIVTASLVIAVLTLALTYLTGFWPVLSLQLATGLASSLIGPGIAALSFGLVGQARLPNRIGRNERSIMRATFARRSPPLSWHEDFQSPPCLVWSF